MEETMAKIYSNIELSLDNQGEIWSTSEVNTYKNRNIPSYYRLTESGWIDVPVHEVNPSEADEV